MPIRISSGLRTSMVGEYGLERMLRRGHIRIYSGVQPMTADSPPTGVLLARVTDNGDTVIPGQTTGGLQMQAGDTAGSLTDLGTWVLKGAGAGTGTANWWRFVWNALDDNTQSDYYPRIDGRIGESLALDDLNITPDTNIQVNEFLLILPAQ